MSTLVQEVRKAGIPPKVVANLLKQVLPDIISPSKGALVSKRQILAGVLKANKLTNSMKRLQKEGAILKTVLEKAYNYVD